MTYSISSVATKITALVIGAIGIISILANIHPLLTTAFASVYCFVVPSLLIQEYLQTKFVGLEIRGKTVFLFPVIIPLLILIAIPFWAYNNAYPEIVVPWVSIILISLILVESTLITKFGRSVIIRITPNKLQDLFLGLAGLIFGLLIAWLL